MSVMSVHWSTVGTEGMMYALSVYSGDRWSDVCPLSLLCGLEELVYPGRRLWGREE
jgi:hypothetical protein